MKNEFNKIIELLKVCKSKNSKLSFCQMVETIMDEIPLESAFEVADEEFIKLLEKYIEEVEIV